MCRRKKLGKWAFSMREVGVKGWWEQILRMYSKDFLLIAHSSLKPSAVFPVTKYSDSRSRSAAISNRAGS